MILTLNHVSFENLRIKIVSKHQRQKFKITTSYRNASHLPSPLSFTLVDVKFFIVIISFEVSINGIGSLLLSI